MTLHVGLGTFAPVQEEDPRDHPMHAEVYHLPEATAEAVARTRARGRVVCRDDERSRARVVWVEEAR